MSAPTLHAAGECGDDCLDCDTYAAVVMFEDDDTRPACPHCGSRRGVQVLGNGTVWCLHCNEPATS